MSFSRFFKYASLSAATASASVLRNVTCMAIDQANSSISSNSTVADDPSDINWGSRDAVIGISCIAASMALITAFFCKKYGKLPETKQATLAVVVKKDNAKSLGEEIAIPQLKLRYSLTPAAHQMIEQIGLMHFLKKEIRHLINKKIKKDDNFEMSESSIKQVMQAFFGNKNLDNQLGIHDLEINVDIIYRPQNKRSHLFERTLQPVTRATMFFEVIFGLIQNIGALQLFGGILPVSREANNDIAITQATLNALFMLLITYVGPGQTFMSDLGAIIDKFLHQCCQRKKDKSEHEEGVEEVKDELLPATRYKIKLTKGVVTVFLINSLYTQVIGDYKTAMSLADNITDMADSMVPAWLVMLSAYLMYGLNQLNDPVNFISTVFMGFTLIDMYFRYKQNNPSPAAVEEILDEESDDEVDEEKEKVELLIPIKPTPLQVLGKFSPKQTSVSNLGEHLLSEESLDDVNKSSLLTIN